MKKIFYSLACLSLVFGYNTASAQNLRYCGTDEVFHKVTTQNPQLLQAQEDLEEHTRNFEQTEANQRSMPPVYIVPVVFHIVHNYGPENISDAQIIDQVRILNEDFRKDNADTSNIISQFQGIAADAEIEFRLARIDPNGNCTNGIDRIASMETYIGDDGSKLNPWPRSKYLNIWVVSDIQSGAAGYAYLPGTAPSASVDGIIILSTYVGSIGTGMPATSRALTHEVGHFLNLRHVWGNTNQPGVACGDDQVTDTPITKGWTSCNLAGSTCTSGVTENVQNFMEYSYCTNMFTQGQRTRMRAALNSGTGQRNSLITNSNLTATGVLITPAPVCAPKADFKGSATSLCAGDNIQFTDYSWNGTPTSWSWSFTGGTPATSTSASPVVTYSTPGTYAVTLTASNSMGSDSETKTSYITVHPAASQYNTWQYFEGLENWPVTNTDWTIKSGNSIPWAQSGTAAFSGGYSFRLNNYSSMAGDVDELVSPSINVSAAVPTPQLSFKLAYAQKAATNTDKLRVLVSDDCGKSWVQRYSKTGPTLKTVTTPVTTAFTPTSGQWRSETVNLSAYSSASNLRFKFEFTGGGGNNIYIDDINLMSATGLDEQTADRTQISVYPNPVEDGSVVKFSLKEKQEVNIGLYDIIGREVVKLHNGDLSQGDHSIELSRSSMPAGIYFVRLEVSGKVFTQKVVLK